MRSTSRSKTFINEWEWHPWFAWHPVLAWVGDEPTGKNLYKKNHFVKWVWLEMVDRKYCSAMDGGGWHEYRVPK